MYDIRQFKPAMYALVLLGITGFALAWQSPGLWILAGGGVALNAWLVWTDRFRPMPRLMANAVTIGGLVIAALLIQDAATTPIFLIGEFLVVLQLVKLYEQRANRDYAQLLILSLLLMVAAAISTASLLFGIMFITYLFLSLYCCLLFHLKIETDHARHAIGIPEERLNPNTLRQDQRYLSRSMRRLTGLLSFFSIIIAVGIFLFFPRGTGSGLLGQMQLKPSQVLTGFSDSVSFQDVAEITQNTQPVAWMTITKDGQPYQGMPILLRGITLDHYTGAASAGGTPYQWTRSISDLYRDLAPDRWTNLDEQNLTEHNGLKQQITLEPTGTSVLFAIGGVSSFMPADGGRFRYAREDQSLQAADPIMSQFHYTVISSDHMTFDPAHSVDDLANKDSSRQSVIDPKIEQFARLPEVSGVDSQGNSLAALRRKEVPVSPLDEAIARNIEMYLRTNFTYTLDLTDTKRIEGQDPLVAFLYDFKKGHCEYFAGAMTLMCQSLGMQARMVVGFKCDDYNSLGDYYTVRQSQAHAWVEVLDSDGVWQTYDPTSGREDTSQHATSMWQRISSIFNYMEYTWASVVVAYDHDRRSSIIQKVENGLTKTTTTGNSTVLRIWNWINDQRSLISTDLITGLIALMSTAMVVLVVWYLAQEWLLRRRARRIGLDVLPATEQMKLARQLGFYDHLLRMLERHRIERPPALTPREFSNTLTFLPVDAFDSIRRLTDAFYRVRYGREELSSNQRRELIEIMASVESSLSS